MGCIYNKVSCRLWFMVSQIRQHHEIADDKQCGQRDYRKAENIANIGVPGNETLDETGQYEQRDTMRE